MGDARTRMGLRVVGSEGNGLLEVSDGSPMLPETDIRRPHVEVCFGVVRLQADSVLEVLEGEL